MDIEEPNFSTSYHADISDDANGTRTELRTLTTAWSDLDVTPWAQVLDKEAAASAVKRYHDSLVAINEMPAADRDAALASIGDLTGADLYTTANRVEAAAQRTMTMNRAPK